MSNRGKVLNGVVVLETPSDWPEGAEVRVELIPVLADDPGDDSGDGLLGMLDFVGDAGISDLSTNLDHYLYGHPKVDDAE